MKKETMLRAINDIDDRFIEEAVPNGYLPKEKTGFSWLNARVLAGAFAVLLMAIFLPGILRPSDSGQPSGTPGGNIQLVNPATGYSTLAEAAEVTGFPMECPNTFKEWNASEINVIANIITDVAYADADGQTVMHIRKAEGIDDISGDYNKYSFEKELEIEGKTVTVKGDDDLCHLLIWSDNGYSYSVTSETGMSLEDAAALAGIIH